MISKPKLFRKSKIKEILDQFLLAVLMTNKKWVIVAEAEAPRGEIILSLIST